VLQLGHVADVDKIAGGGDTRDGDHVFEFPDAAGKADDAFAVSVVVFFEQELDQQRHDVDAGIATKRALEKVERVGILKVDAGEGNQCGSGRYE
jgi:hypothetical protein